MKRFADDLLVNCCVVIAAITVLGLFDIHIWSYNKGAFWALVSAVCVALIRLYKGRKAATTDTK